MSRTGKPPRVVMMRPKSAGSMHHATSLTAAAESKETTLPWGSSISQITKLVPTHPARPPTNIAKRPSSANSSRRRTERASHFVQLPSFPRGVEFHNTATTQDGFPREDSPEEGGSNIYYTVVARKDAEDAAKQLARRIARFRSQEERVLREMQSMRVQLETRLQPPEGYFTILAPIAPAGPALSKMLAPSRRIQLQDRSVLDTSKDKVSGARQSRPSTASQNNRRTSVPRSREQLEFLAKQKRILEARKHEVARQQKERLKTALAEQKMKEAEQDRKRRCRIERIRSDEQQVLEYRTEKKLQMQEATRKQHYERLITERHRQQEALSLIAEMEEEERNLRLRVEALHFHRSVMKQELRGNAAAHGDNI